MEKRVLIAALLSGVVVVLWFALMGPTPLFRLSVNRRLPIRRYHLALPRRRPMRALCQELRRRTLDRQCTATKPKLLPWKDPGFR